ncbi:MAG: CopG family transcriptional regulator [Chloroflexota bacterium]
MKRTTLSLTPEIAYALDHEARRRGQSVSAVAREALAAHLHVSSDKKRDLPFIGAGKSGHRTTARDMEALMATEWALDRDR